MPQKLIATLFVSLWLALLGIEAAEQGGLFAFSDQEVDNCVDAAVLGLGIALQLPEDTPGTPLLSPPPVVPQLAESVVALKPHAALIYSRQRDAFLGPPNALCKLYSSLLI
jgi:hypothetical protein